MEETHTRVINSTVRSLTEGLLKADTVMADQALHYQALDDGVKSTFERIDKDLEALNQRVNHH